VGKGLEELPRIAAEKRAPFDLTFIDADKPSNPEYFRWALKLSRHGSLIIVDNVVRDGAVLREDGGDPGIAGIRRMSQMIAAEPRVSATVIQTVGSKGYDGMLIALVTA
jgi:predicted O-methyltransferase YrrM